MLATGGEPRNTLEHAARRKQQAKSGHNQAENTGTGRRRLEARSARHSGTSGGARSTTCPEDSCEGHCERRHSDSRPLPEVHDQGRRVLRSLCLRARFSSLFRARLSSKKRKKRPGEEDRSPNKRSTRWLTRPTGQAYGRCLGFSPPRSLRAAGVFVFVAHWAAPETWCAGMVIPNGPTVPATPCKALEPLLPPGVHLLVRRTRHLWRQRRLLGLRG